MLRMKGWLKYNFWFQGSQSPMEKTHTDNIKKLDSQW